MRAETSATSAITALSVAVAALGHALAGGAVSLTVLPQLLVLAALGWTLGEHLSNRRLLSLTTLATLQLTTHLTLDATHPAISTTAPPTADDTALSHAATATEHSAVGHAAVMDHAAMGHGAVEGMAGTAGAQHGGTAAGGAAGGMHDGFAGALTMSAAHLLVLLAGVVLVGSAHRWVQRVAGILARLVPHLPEPAVAIPGVRAALLGVPEQPRLTQRWLTSSVSRRGPPQYGVLAAPS